MKSKVATSGNSDGEVGDSSEEDAIEQDKRKNISKQLPLPHAQAQTKNDVSDTLSEFSLQSSNVDKSILTVQEKIKQESKVTITDSIPKSNSGPTRDRIPSRGTKQEVLVKHSHFINSGTKSFVPQIQSLGSNMNPQDIKFSKKLGSGGSGEGHLAPKFGRIPAEELSSDTGSHLLSDSSSIFSGFKSNSQYSAKSLTSQ